MSTARPGYLREKRQRSVFNDHPLKNHRKILKISGILYRNLDYIWRYGILLSVYFILRGSLAHCPGLGDKSTFHWISVIRMPDFVTKAEFDWAVVEASRKKKLDCSAAEFLTIDEGECVQIMHLGAFDDEPATVALMDEYIAANGHENDFSDTRLHHEIYLTDARKVAKDKWKTVIRHPVKKAE